MGYVPLVISNIIIFSSLSLFSFPLSIFPSLTVDERKEKLLKVLTDSIKVVGKLFGYMIKILKDEDTVLADNAAETLLKNTLTMRNDC